MSDSRLLGKYTELLHNPRPIVRPEEGAAISEAEGEERFACFGWLRGLRDRAVSLELRKKTGNILAIGYGWIEKCEFDPSEGITLYALGQKIYIRGRNLNTELRTGVRLFEGIVRQRVPWIQEADQSNALAADRQAVVVERIDT